MYSPTGDDTDGVREKYSPTRDTEATDAAKQ